MCLQNTIKYNTIKEWDSVGHMTMIGNLEEAFNITLEMDDISYEIIFYVNNKGLLQT